MGEYLGRRLHDLKDRHPCVGDVRGMGLFWTLELVRDRESQTPLRRVTEKYTQTIVKTLAEFLFEKRDIYVPSDKFGIWIVPPLIVNQEEIDFLIPAIDDALKMADDWLRKNS